ncbi:MAG: glycosyltransferase, partial [Thermohalobaculum sp.]|nr:glycosyltransferase [Thermohalobaculum sp.]
MRLGYLVPEFPGQTHIFFWREIAALKRLGIEPVLLSSREADRRLQSHDWSADAKARTTYLVPLGAGALLRGLGAALGSGAAGWRQAIMLAREARGHGKIRLAGLALFGAVLAGHARRLRLDHIHCHSCASTALVTAFAHCFSGVPYSLTLHGALHDYGPDQAAKWRRAAFGVAITRRLEVELRETLGAACTARIEVAPMGVDLARFAREAAQP